MEKQNKLETGNVVEVKGFDQAIFNVNDDSVETCKYYGGDIMTIESYTWKKNKDGLLGSLDNYVRFTFPEQGFVEREKLLENIGLIARGNSLNYATRLCSKV